MATCFCDQISTPDCLDIAPGLSELPRQYLGFGEFRRALIEDIARNSALAAWSAEGEQDLGVMLLEMWAYVLDTTQFYDARITEEFYLATARRTVSANRLVKLLGYRPRPALAASVTLVGEAEGFGTVRVPEGTAFRSAAFEDEPPQVFSAITSQELEPHRNTFAVRPVSGTAVPGRLLFSAQGASVPKAGVLAFASGGAAVHAGTIIATEQFAGPDGRRYLEVTLREGIAAVDALPVANLETRLMGLTAGPTRFGDTFSGDALILDGVYPQIRAGDLAVLEMNGALHPFVLQEQSDWTADVVVGTTPALSDPEIAAQDIKAPATRVELPAIAGVSLDSTSQYRLHFHPLQVGAPSALALTSLGLSDIAAGVALEPAPPQAPAVISGEFVLKGEAPVGAKVAGQVTVDPLSRATRFAPAAGASAFPAPLIAPLSLHGNLLSAVRGEKVTGEVLGSADGGSPVNRFKLAKKPLTWIAEASATDGIRPLLEVRVGGLLWHRVDTLYTAGAEDRVYLVELDEDGASHVVFGDGRRGARPGSGVNNVTATYYHGAGAAKPPPGTIKQIVKPPKGLRRVFNPLPATGGKDAESREDLRLNAPAAALTLGRAVSVQDFAALARTYAGVINVTAGWAWDKRRQRAIVSVWVIGESAGAVEAAALEAWLAGQAAMDTPVRVIPAVGDPHSLALSLDVDPAHEPSKVGDAVHAALVDARTGFLAPRNLAIGGTLFRSQLVEKVHAQAGVAAITSVRLDNAEMDWAYRVPAGHYLDFTSVMVA